jgi:predicted dinucleotide-binding enzyme
LSDRSGLPTLAVLGGTGNEGRGLALRWAHAGYDVIIGSREQEKAERTAAELNGLLGKDAVQECSTPMPLARQKLSS